MNKRTSGILLHISSLPSKYGIGDFGPEAYAFADFLTRAGQRTWQVLPLAQTEMKYGNCPYSGPSLFAGNILLISPEMLMREGLCDRKDLKNAPKFPVSAVNFKKVTAFKKKLLAKIYVRKEKRKHLNRAFEAFCVKNRDWLDDHALFEVLKEKYHHRSWRAWPKKVRCRNKKALAGVEGDYADEIECIKFVQFLFTRQWHQLRKYCNAKKIRIMGDVPIYVNYESVDVWANPGIFKLDKNFKQKCLAGVPPDYFSETGQMWGNPVYDWGALKRQKFDWWIKRLRHQLALYDNVRLDHFRGFAAYWEVPAGEKTAMKGKWVNVPGKQFFNTVKKQLKKMPFIAEDVGYITQDVRELMRAFKFPGMKLLHFAFDGNPGNDYLPHHYEKHCVAYTGTHDNSTTKGWYTKEISKEQRRMISVYLKKKIDPKNVHWDLIKLVMNSQANTTVVPLQDILGLGAGAKMNRPGTTEGNWRWRMAGRVPRVIEEKFRKITRVTKRTH